MHVFSLMPPEMDAFIWISGIPRSPIANQEQSLLCSSWGRWDRNWTLRFPVQYWFQGSAPVARTGNPQKGQ
jgi:hypothetical protein